MKTQISKPFYKYIPKTLKYISKIVEKYDMIEKLLKKYKITAEKFPYIHIYRYIVFVS